MEGISPWSKMSWSLGQTAKREKGCMPGMLGLGGVANSQRFPSNELHSTLGEGVTEEGS